MKHLLALAVGIVLGLAFVEGSHACDGNRSSNVTMGAKTNPISVRTSSTQPKEGVAGTDAVIPR